MPHHYETLVTESRKFDSRPMGVGPNKMGKTGACAIPREDRFQMKIPPCGEDGLAIGGICATKRSGTNHVSRWD